MLAPEETAHDQAMYAKWIKLRVSSSSEEVSPQLRAPPRAHLELRPEAVGHAPPQPCTVATLDDWILRSKHTNGRRSSRHSRLEYVVLMHLIRERMGINNVEEQFAQAKACLERGRHQQSQC